jgi:hypothetical protein
MSVPDAPRMDRPPDMDPSVTWSVDASSGKSVPSTAAEWLDFIGNKKLNIVAPDGLWLMQEASGALQDSIGTVNLPSMGNDAPQYQQPVPGWTRKAVKSMDGTGVLFYNNTDASLPNVGTTSMTVLLMYANASMPAGTRSIVVAGCCAGYATLSIDAAKHYRLNVNVTGNAVGLMDHGADVTPIVVKLDRTAARQVVITDRETIAPTNTQLGSQRGLYLGAANGAAPDGRWLYMAAWYGANAEMSDASISALIKALGW